MNQNTFCSKCHRIPSQCCCNTAPRELSDEEIKPLLDRIQNYLECGGLFNPELMEHDKVRDLIMDCKAILKKASEK
jgi:hypothetical protein